MKTIAKFVFKVHRLIYGYPCRSEVRLSMEDDLFGYGLTWYVGMLYICDESISDISEWMDLSEKEVKEKLNLSVKRLKL